MRKTGHIAVLNSFQFQNGNFNRKNGFYFENVIYNVQYISLKCRADLNQTNIMLTLQLRCVSPHFEIYATICLLAKCIIYFFLHLFHSN